MLKGTGYVRNRIIQEISVIEKEFPEDIVLYSVNGAYPRIIQTVYFVLKYYSKGKVLDIGPGFGIIPRILKQFNFSISLLDYTYTKQKLKMFNKFGFGTATCDASSEKFPFESSYFDIVLMSEIIEHIYLSPKHLLNEAYRILKPNGIIIITTPNFVNLRKRLWMFFGKSPMDKIEIIYNRLPYERHSHEYTMKELCSVLKWSKFSILERYFYNFIAYQTVTKKAKEEGEFNQCAKEFRINSIRQALKIPYILISILIPSLRDTLLVIGKKQI